MTFDTLPPGVSPADCDPEPWDPPEDPDRYCEHTIEREYAETDR